MPTSSAERRREALLAHALLALLLALCFTFLWFYVPRMNNYVMSDREFTGWVGPIAERFAAGERPYVDFVLPIPPGSFALLALIQKIGGRPLLLQELWVAAISHLVMAVLAYAMAVRLTTRHNALLVAAGTFILVTQSPKELVYDHTSQVCAWLSITLGLYAASTQQRRRRSLLWFGAGLTATATLIFKQSTAVGVVGGWGLALAYLVAVAWAGGGRRAALPRLRDVAHCAAGGVSGLFLLLVVLAALGSNLGDFVQSVFGDGPELKGGRAVLLTNLFNYVFRHDAVRSSLLLTGCAVGIGTLAVHQKGSLHVGDEAAAPPPLTFRTAAWTALAFALTFGIATALLAGEVRLLDRKVTATLDGFRLIPTLGFAFAILFFVLHLRSPAADAGGAPAEHGERGHLLNVFVLVAMTSSLFYNTSFIHFSPFYYNNPEIPLALVCLFIAARRTGRGWVTGAVFAVCALSFYGIKLNRALSADTVVRSGQWAGMRVNYRGRELLKAARRIQSLTEPHETVLVLPEDVQLVGLIGRPRPPVRGAILFVDQYPRRLLEEDLRALDAAPPKVIVIHPRRRSDWQRLYNTWSRSSAAQVILEHALDDLLPDRYRLDSTYPTIYFWDQGQLQIWVREDDAEIAGPGETNAGSGDAPEW